VEDVNGDGRADLVWQEMQTGDVVVFLGWDIVDRPLEKGILASGVPLPWQIQ